MMRVAAFGVLVLAFGYSAADEKKDVPKELAPFQGTWKVVKADFGGVPLPADKLDALRFTFKGDKVTVKEGKDGKDDTGSYSVDAKQDPPHINLVSPKGEKSLGIYKFDKGGKLTLAFTQEGKGKDPKPETRPTAFDAKKVGVMVLEKVKE